MRVLVSGGAGFIGSHTVDWFCKNHHDVLVVDNLSSGKTENLKSSKGKFHLCDITDEKILEKSFADFYPDVVIHLAAQSAITVSEENPEKDLDINAKGTIKMLKLSNKYGVKKFVFSSTSAVYHPSKPLFGGMNEKYPQEPNTPYGISKFAAEQYIRMMFPNHVIYRYGNVYGPRQTPVGENQVIARAFRHLIHGDDFKVTGDGKQKRDFIFVEDVAYANFLATLTNETGTFNLCTGKSYSVNQVLREVAGFYGVGAYPWIHTSTPDKRGDVLISNSRLKKTFGLSILTSLEEGIRKTAYWWEQDKLKK